MYYGIYQEGAMAGMARLFKNGRSQAVRLPAEYRLPGSEVYICREGDAVVLRPKPSGWDDFFAAPSTVPKDFLETRDQPKPQKRKHFR
jgi:antitoxin VapB